MAAMDLTNVFAKCSCKVFYPWMYNPHKIYKTSGSMRREVVELEYSL
jgi:hypothetical protein